MGAFLILSAKLYDVWAIKLIPFISCSSSIYLKSLLYELKESLDDVLSFIEGE